MDSRIAKVFIKRCDERCVKRRLFPTDIAEPAATTIETLASETILIENLDLAETKSSTVLSTTQDLSAGTSSKKNLKYCLSEDSDNLPDDVNEADFTENEYHPSTTSEDSTDKSENDSLIIKPKPKKRAVARNKTKLAVSTTETIEPNLSYLTEDRTGTSGTSGLDKDAPPELVNLCNVIIKKDDAAGSSYAVYLDVENVIHNGSGIKGRVVEHLNIYMTTLSGPKHRLSHECSLPGTENDNLLAACFWQLKTGEVEILPSYCLQPGKYQSRATFVRLLGHFYAPFFFPREASSDTFPIVDEKTKSKLHFCFFCKKLKTSIARHISMAHKDIPFIAKAARKGVDQKYRNNVLEHYRKKGDNLYNDMAKERGLSCRIVVRRPKKISQDNYLSCPVCKRYYTRSNLARHEMKCSRRPANYYSAVRAQRNQEAVDVATSKADLLSRITSKMLDDEIGRIAKCDKTIVGMMEIAANAYAKEKHLDHNIRQNARMLGRLLVQLKENSEIKELSDALHPSHYEDIINAVYKVCGLNNATYDFKIPQVAMKYRSVLTKCIEYWEHNFQKNNILESALEVQTLLNFKKLFHGRYNSDVNKKALRTSLENKLRNKRHLPDVEDIFKYSTYLKECASQYYEKLHKRDFSYKYWFQLGEVLLLEIQLFNRRRIGETLRIPLEAFNKRESINDEQKSAMSRLDLFLANNLERMQSIGKRGRVLSFLISKDLIKYLKLYVALRSEAGVDPDNPNLFVSSSNGVLNGYAAIVKYSVGCGAKEPNSLRGTALRKQVATMSQMFTLSDNDIQQIADFMGHDVNVHKAVYRTPDLTLQITKLSKFFMAVGDTNLLKYKNKSIDELIEIGGMQPEEDTHSSYDVQDEHDMIDALRDEVQIEQAEQGVDNRHKCDAALQEDVFTADDNLPEWEMPELDMDLEFSHQDNEEPQSSNHINQPTSVCTRSQTPDINSSSKSVPQATITSSLTPSKKMRSKEIGSMVVSPAPKNPDRKGMTVTQGKRNKVMWTAEEKRLVRDYFSTDISRKRQPSRDKLNTFLKKFANRLKHRDSTKLYSWIQAEIRRNS